MPFSSAQIAQMNGSFMQQHMQQLQFAQMIEPQGFNVGGYNTRAQSEGLAGKAMNTSSAIGAPMAMLGMGMMGLDPMSMGIRAGAGAMGAGAGFGGAALTGMAAGGAMAGGLAAVGYMGNQIMAGASQTQQFNSSMRGGYSFFNPQAAHGRGFSDSDTRSIGNSMRNMAGEGGLTELGPSFSELGRLASNMGRMGLADGVRNAKEFTDKFREMMKSVKTIAEDMGTTLEEAQKTMASMKGSGIFKNQAQVGSSIRSASVAGGLATTEVTGMMNVGSQISRMFGGTGKQGAMGGIKAIEQVGMAQQMGTLSEEDIYQATGLSGAEGRQAMAQQQMMQTGSFLKSSKGRWLLASLAGKDGKLNQGSVNDFLTGGMSVNDTRNAAHKNLAGIGRANFIRNEGRLRGSVMEEFGGMAPAMAMMGWAQGKGIDIHSMGDREMLFMQRQLGMGRDEADSLVKMAKSLPEMMAHRRAAREDDTITREHGMRAQNSGIEGVKRKFEAARDKVNNEMNKAGQDILNVATDKIAEWGNRIAGTYEEHIISGVREAHRVAMMGGREGKAAMGQLLGTGGGAFIRDLGGKSLGGIGGPRENFSQSRYRDHVEDLQFSARMGSAGGMSSEMAGLVKGNSLELKRAYADELSGLGGEDRMAAFKRHFGKDTEMGKKFRAMGQSQQAEFMQQMEGDIGIKTGKLSETFQVPGLPDMVGGGNLRTEAQRQEAMGRSMLGLGKSGLAGAASTIGAGLGAIIGGAGMMGLGRKAGGMGSQMIEEWNGNAKRARAAGQMLDDPEMRRIAFDTLSGAKGSEEALLGAISNIRGAGAERGGLDKLTEDEQGRLGALESVRLTADLMKTANAKGGVDKMSNSDWDKLVQKRKRTVKEMGGDPDAVTRESILSQAQGVQGAASEQRKEIVNQLALQVGRTSRQEMQALRAGGIAKLVTTGGAGARMGGTAVETLQLTEQAQKDLMKKGGAGAVQAAQMALEVQSLGMEMSKASSPEEKAEIYARMQDRSGNLYDKMSGMDVKSLRSLGSSMAGTQVGGQATEMLMRGQSMTASTRKLGAAGAVAAQLGLSFGADELKGLKGMSPEAAAAALAARMGVGDDKGFMEGLKDSIAAAGKKGGGIQGAALLTRAMSGANEETKKKLEEMAKGQQSPDEKIIDKIGEGNRYLEALVRSNAAAQAKLGEIAGNTRTPDGEKT